MDPVIRCWSHVQWLSEPAATQVGAQVGAHLCELRRTAIGDICVSRSWRLHELEELVGLCPNVKKEGFEAKSSTKVASEMTT